MYEKTRFDDSNNGSVGLCLCLESIQAKHSRNWVCSFVVLVADASYKFDLLTTLQSQERIHTCMERA